jgi:hypothetical protein
MRREGKGRQEGGREREADSPEMDGAEGSKGGLQEVGVAHGDSPRGD